jgi:hypothetical protein
MYFVKKIAKYILHNFTVNNRASCTNYVVYLAGCVISTTLANITFKTQHMTCHYVDTDSSISYAKLKKDFHKPKAGTIILGINSHTFESNGNVYVKELDCDLYFDTFIMISSIDNNLIEYDYIKETDTSDIIKTMSFIPKKFNDMYKIDTINKTSYIEWNGITFCTLSEELMTSLCLMGINVTCENIMRSGSGTNDKQKHVVIIDINYEKLSRFSSEVSLFLQQKGLPYMRVDELNEYNLAFIEKIGQKKIININDVINSFGKKTNITITCTTMSSDENFKFTL